MKLARLALPLIALFLLFSRSQSASGKRSRKGGSKTIAKKKSTRSTSQSASTTDPPVVTESSESSSENSSNQLSYSTESESENDSDFVTKRKRPSKKSLGKASGKPKDDKDEIDIEKIDLDTNDLFDAEEATCSSDATLMGRVLGCGRCFLRSILDYLSRVLGIDLTFEDVNRPGTSYSAPAGTDFRTNNSMGHRRVMAAAMRQYANAYYDYITVDADEEARARDAFLGDLRQWHDGIVDADLMDETVDPALWTDQRIIVGAAIYHDVNIDLYDHDSRRVFDPGHRVGDDRPTILLNYIRDENGNGVHFDLRFNPDPLYTDYDSLLWAEDTNPFPAPREEVIDRVRGFLDMDMARTDHFRGAIAMVPRHLLRTTEALRRILGRFPRAFYDMVMRPGFRPDRIESAALDAIENEVEGILDPNTPGGVYIRCDARTVGDHREERQSLLDDGTEVIDKVRKMEEYCRTWLRNNRATASTTPSSALYIGETSDGKPTDRWIFENDPNKRDGADGQWEYFLIFVLTHQFVFGYVEKGSKFQAWLLEAFALGIMQMAAIASVGGSFRLLASDATGLNGVNGGVPWFLTMKCSLSLIVNWFVRRSKLFRDHLIFSSNVVPPTIRLYCKFHAAQILTYCGKRYGITSLTYLTVTMAHSFLSYRGTLGLERRRGSNWFVELAARGRASQKKRRRESMDTLPYRCSCYDRLRAVDSLGRKNRLFTLPGCEQPRGFSEEDLRNAGAYNMGIVTGRLGRGDPTKRGTMLMVTNTVELGLTITHSRGKTAKCLIVDRNGEAVNAVNFGHRWDPVKKS